ncbi:MAG: hypothetical protein Gaeavirus7_9 [Gaeavirus sp.]|uniref:Leucine-rich repeat protein n=1 Tax=Gaeavirus sp. TaxID=2487767 RepID=A0A3G4ZYU0_9VIRU|nr:MAG: hypothetical protein Gaeavirus7_9 [Gaeavirus sp.]
MIKLKTGASILNTTDHENVYSITMSHNFSRDTDFRSINIISNIYDLIFESLHLFINLKRIKFIDMVLSKYSLEHITILPIEHITFKRHYFHYSVIKYMPPTLKSLKFNRCEHITENDDISTLTNLEEINVRTEYLMDSECKQGFTNACNLIFHIHNLKKIILANGIIADEILSDLYSNLSELTDLTLEAYHIKSIHSSISKLSKIKHLCIKNVSNLPEEISELTELESLEIHNVSSISLSISIMNLNLKSLIIRNMRDPTKIPNEYAKIKSITIFDCSNPMQNILTYEDSLVIFKYDYTIRIPEDITRLYINAVDYPDLNDLPLSIDTLTINSWEYPSDSPLTNLPPSLKKLTLSGSSSRNIKSSGIKLPYGCELIIINDTKH